MSLTRPSVSQSVRNGKSSPRNHDTDIYCRAFSNGAVTTCFYDLHLSRLGFEQQSFRWRGERSNPCTIAAVIVCSKFKLGKQRFTHRISIINLLSTKNYLGQSKLIKENQSDIFTFSVLPSVRKEHCSHER